MCSAKHVLVYIKGAAHWCTHTASQLLWGTKGLVQTKQRIMVLFPTITSQELSQDLCTLNFAKLVQSSLLISFITVVISAVLPLNSIGCSIIINIIVWLFITVIDAQVMKDTAAYDKLIEPVDSVQLQVHELPEALLECAECIFNEHSCA